MILINSSTGWQLCLRGHLIVCYNGELCTKVYLRSLGPQKCLCKLFIQLSYTLLMAYFPYGTYSQLLNGGVLGCVVHITRRGKTRGIQCWLLLTLGVHVQRGLRYLVCVSVCVCVCVCVCFYAYFSAMGNEADSEQYQRLQYYKRSKNEMEIFLKRPCSSSRNWQCR